MQWEGYWLSLPNIPSQMTDRINLTIDSGQSMTFVCLFWIIFFLAKKEEQKQIKKKDDARLIQLSCNNGKVLDSGVEQRIVVIGPRMRTVFRFTRLAVTLRSKSRSARESSFCTQSVSPYSRSVEILASGIWIALVPIFLAEFLSSHVNRGHLTDFPKFNTVLLTKLSLPLNELV